MKFRLSTGASMEAVKLATTKGSRYLGLAKTCYSDSDVDLTPADFLGPVIMDDERSETGALAMTGTDNFAAECQRRIDWLATHPKAHGYYGMPWTRNESNETEIFKWQSLCFGAFDLFQHQKAAFPSLYWCNDPSAVAQALYPSLSCNWYTDVFIHPRINWHGPLRTDAEWKALLNAIATCKHPITKRVVRSVIYWCDGDADLRMYSRMEPNDPDPVRAIEIQAAKLLWSDGFQGDIQADVVAEQTHFVGMI